MTKYLKVFIAAFILLLIMGVYTSEAQTGTMLRFSESRTFRVVQFTDIHWDNNKPNCKETEKTMKMVISAENPDLIVLTGDIVTISPAARGWDAIAAIISETGIPWAVTLGNHDDEAELTRTEIFNLLSTKKGFVGEQGPEGLPGAGNYVLQIKASDAEKTAALIYCIDSQGYPTDKKSGSYDWVKFEQIGWYRNQSRTFTSASQGSPLPALAYFHIPTPEFKEVHGTKSCLGNKNEEVNSPLLNSGLVASMIEMGDVMGAFCGHDHDNNYIALYHSLALAYGQVTGVNAYGRYERGARVVEISEGEYGFNTWIRTASGVSFQYNFPLGDSYDESDYDFLKPVELARPVSGIRYNYFEGDFVSSEDFKKAKPLKQGIIKGISLEPRLRDDHFGFEYTGFLKIEKRGLYRFYTHSDDGSRLYIGNRLVVDNDGSHSPRRVDGTVALEAGFHEFRLLYFEDYMGQILETGISGPGFREKPVSGDLLYMHDGSADGPRK